VCLLSRHMHAQTLFMWEIIQQDFARIIIFYEFVPLFVRISRFRRGKYGDLDSTKPSGRIRDTELIYTPKSTSLLYIMWSRAVARETLPFREIACAPVFIPFLVAVTQFGTRVDNAGYGKARTKGQTGEFCRLMCARFRLPDHK